MSAWQVSAREKGEPLRYSLRARLLAAASYGGALCVLWLAWPVRSPFIVRHARVALAIHGVRALLLISALLVAGLRAGLDLWQGVQIALSSVLVLLVGIPWVPSLASMEHGPVFWLTLGTWVLSLLGATLALAGKTIDIGAMLNAGWPEEPPAEPVQLGSAEDLERLRALSQARLTRMQEASRAAALERQRRERIALLETQRQLVAERRAQLRLLASQGELSEVQRAVADRELADYDRALAAELEDWRQRRPVRQPAPAAPAVLTHLPEAVVQAVTIIDQAGVPLASWGDPVMDDAPAAGMMLALESLTEGMTGSPVQKTGLGEGTVVLVARGTWTRLLAWFSGDPAPAQEQRLRAYLEAFEQANERLLQHAAGRPEHLTLPPLPYALPPRTPSAR